MRGMAQACVDWMMTAVATTGVFGDKLFEVSDPSVLQDIAKKLNYPVCGVVYEGIVSGGAEGDQGAASYMHVSLMVLADAREREVRQTADKGRLATIMDDLRDGIKRKISPTNHPWTFVMEVPVDLGNRGLVFYQKWKTEVIL